MNTLPWPAWWMPSYPEWLDPDALPGVCIVCHKLAHVMHHLYSRQLRPEVAPMCRTCEGAVHARNRAKPGTMPRILDLRALLPRFAVHEEGPSMPRIERILVKDGAIPSREVRLGGASS